MTLIEVLRSRNPETDPDCHEAADEIERLREADRIGKDNFIFLNDQIKRLREALKPFAEEPTERMDDYPCHKGLTTKENCSRCGKAIRAWQALAAKEN